MPAAADLPAEFSGPVAYDDRWLWFALAGLVLVAAYYAAVVWFTRPPQVAVAAPPRADVPTQQQLHLQRIERVAADVRQGRLSARDGHQQLSEVVRSYVAAVTSLPAPTMALADIRQQVRHPLSGELSEAIELMYPPEFAPDGEAQERFDDALARSRRLVTTWS